MDREEYVERVLRVVEEIPPGRVMTYGAVADAVGRGGPRQVGGVMAGYGGPVPWWRVIRADGRPPPGHEREALRHYAEEGTPLRSSVSRARRVDLRRAFWTPDVPADGDDL